MNTLKKIEEQIKNGKKINKEELLKKDFYEYAKQNNIHYSKIIRIIKQYENKKWSQKPNLNFLLYFYEKEKFFKEYIKTKLTQENEKRNQKQLNKRKKQISNILLKILITENKKNFQYLDYIYNEELILKKLKPQNISKEFIENIDKEYNIFYSNIDISKIENKIITDENLNQKFIIKIKKILKREEYIYEIINKNISHLNFLDKDEIKKEIKKKINSLNNKTNEKINKIIKEKIEEATLKNENLRKKELELITQLKSKASIEKIENFYKKAREKQREIIGYYGPTNSGKTFEALKEFENSKKAVYLAPLRLLAREIFDKYKNKLKISLITGEEKIIIKNQTHITSTIEMIDINKEYDLVIIDEFQMINDEQRGNAWSRAILGINAKKIIIIGSNNIKQLTKEISLKCNDIYSEKSFERLNELKILEKKINIRELKKGDAIIVFSRKDIYKLKQNVEKLGLKVSVVYGALPPETRIKQAEIFNKEETDILIATNAIGFGLNLNIKRIIYYTVSKWNGIEMQTITKSEFKQISGRAGRYKINDFGEVLYLDSDELWKIEDFYNYISLINKKENKNINKAFYFPEYEHLYEFKNIKNFNNKLNEIILEYNKYYIESTNTFELINIEQYYKNAIIIDEINPKLNLKEKYQLAFAPLNINNGYNLEIFENYLKGIENKIENYYELSNINKKEIFIIEEIANDLLLINWLEMRNKNQNKEKIKKYQNEYEKISNLIHKKLII
jgi:ATP-dependent RNA helicase SUPV3L1/SUV3